MKADWAEPRLSLHLTSTRWLSRRFTLQMYRFSRNQDQWRVFFSFPKQIQGSRCKMWPTEHHLTGTFTLWERYTAARRAPPAATPVFVAIQSPLLKESGKRGRWRTIAPLTQLLALEVPLWWRLRTSASRILESTATRLRGPHPWSTISRYRLNPANGAFLWDPMGPVGDLFPLYAIWVDCEPMLKVGGSDLVLVDVDLNLGKTTILKILGGKHMVEPEMVRIFRRSAFHDTALTSSGDLSYLGGEVRRENLLMSGDSGLDFGI